MINWLEKCKDPEEEGHYLLSKILENKFEVRPLAGDGFLVLKQEDISVEFAVLRVVSTYDNEQSLQRVFFGHGFEGSLRECRHTYWGEDPNNKDGYLFYPSGKIIAAAFKELSEFFDDMA